MTISIISKEQQAGLQVVKMLNAHFPQWEVEKIEREHGHHLLRLQVSDSDFLNQTLTPNDHFINLLTSNHVQK